MFANLAVVSNCAQGGDVWVVDLGLALDLRRLERVLRGEGYGKAEDATLICTVYDRQQRW